MEVDDDGVRRPFGDELLVLAFGDDFFALGGDLFVFGGLSEVLIIILLETTDSGVTGTAPLVLLLDGRPVLGVAGADAFR
jgi:hypothetical protein